ncbi:TolC family protein [Nitrosomonas sp. Is37]|uniref:TolC family protein n=1 Tax=Nitrosomonas sp. Is37 TaxID=3080535 RepID=UPI00294B10E9|nr:TolC family protein [Nitrosomonas sp. Is37]MDV6344694.1 TolC family protein [Nitrosomonas sp. Is37]
MIASSPDSTRNVFSILRNGIIAVWVLGMVIPLNVRADASNHAHPAIFQQDKPTVDGKQVTPLATLITEVLQNNPEIQAAQREREAAQRRISPAEALDDPVLEAGVINAPLASSPFNREDMTMKMIGLSQRFPFPGKRGLRKEVASKDAEAIDYGYQETVNRVVRDLKVAYFDLGLTLEMTKLVEKNKLILEDLTHLAVDHYRVGMGTQADAFKAQTQVSRMQDELLKLARERPVIEAELIRTLGHSAYAGELIPESLHIHQASLKLESLRERAMTQRPQLLALQSLATRNKKAVELAQKAYYPDFDVRLAYGQRDRMLDNTSRPDMVSLTVAINLPVWRTSKIEPRIAESQALHYQALDLHQAQSNEIAAKLRQQVATAEQNFKSVQLYQTTILPQARLTVESALAAYRVNQVDFLTLLDSQMTVSNYEISLVTAIANYNKALAEIDLLTGKTPDELAHHH